MRLTREKIIRLSHQITDVLVESQEVEFVDDRDTIRQQVVQILSGTSSTRSITRMSFAAWASPPPPTTGIGRNFSVVVVRLHVETSERRGTGGARKIFGLKEVPPCFL